jgi:hypothetical protein
MTRSFLPAATRRIGVAALAVALVGCFPPPAPRRAGSPRERVESIWDFAPKDASLGAVFHERAFSRALAMWASLSKHATARPGKAKEPPTTDTLPPFETADDWARAGLDPSLEAAVFTWPDPDRGALVVVPVRDRALFRTAFRAQTRLAGAREVDDLINGYACTLVVERMICAKSLADIDASAAAHSSPIAYRGEHLGPDDTGDVEIVAISAAPQIAEMVKKARDYGTLSGAVTSVRLRDDGVTLRAHAIGEMVTPLARAFAGSAPTGNQPTAAGAPSVIRVHFDPVAVAAESKTMDDAEKHDLVEQLTGDLEMTTSGHGLFGAHATIGLKDEARVLGNIKEKCREASGFKVGSNLQKVTVTERGCSALFDPKLVLISVLNEPVPISFEVESGKLVFSAGGARAPSAEERTTAGVVPESDAAFALADTEALVAFTQSPFVGPDVGAGEALKKVSPLVTDDAAEGVDKFNDVGAHIAQAFIAGRVEEGGVVVTAGFVTFAGDPPEVRAAYDRALEARAAGDVVGYRGRLAEIERKYPRSLAGRRAAIVRTTGPFLGAGALGFATLGVWLDALGSVIDLKKTK